MVYEKLGLVADILRMIVYCVCILCVIAFGVRYYDGIITLDQFLLYTVCAMMLVQILHRDQKGQKTENGVKKSTKKESDKE